LRFHVYAKKT